MDKQQETSSETKEKMCKMQGISAKLLTSYGYAVCFFPEQPKRQSVVEAISTSEERIEKIYSPLLTANTPESCISPKLIRLHWRNRLTYLLASISFCMSLTNVYNFPMNIYKYGINFFIPYTIATIFIGFPLHALESSMGQYTQRGSLWIWQCAPLFFGVGISMVIACILNSLYCTIFAAYSLVYFSHSFSKVFPWTYCNNIFPNNNRSCMPFSLYRSENYPPDEWYLGSFKWWLLLSLVFSWSLIYVITLRSTRSVGKFLLISLIYNYFAVLILLNVGFRLHVSLKQFSYNQAGSIFNFEMWISAILQTLLELGICHGIPIVYGSYCHPETILYFDSLILCIINYANSVIFTILFFLYIKSFSCNLDDFMKHFSNDTLGPAIMYIAYSEAFSSLPNENFWSIILFLMLFLIPIGTQTAITETIMTAVYDEFPNLSRFRSMLNFGICVFFFLFGLIFCSTNGYYSAITLQSIPTLFPVLPLSFLFALGIVFVHGVKHYTQNAQTMFKKIYRNLFFQTLVIILLLVLVLLLLSLPTNILSNDFSKYHTFSWILCGIILVPVLIGGIFWIIYCLSSNIKILQSSALWRRNELKKHEDPRKFREEIYSFYLWEWNTFG